MDDNGGKMAGISQMAWLKQLFQKWQTMTLGPKDGCSGGGIRPAVKKRLKAESDSWESDEESCRGRDPPLNVPKDCVSVYVGPEQRLFIIPTAYLGMPVFKLLLEKAAEEFGYDIKGALRLPCEVKTFKYILQAIRRDGFVDLADAKRMISQGS